MIEAVINPAGAGGRTLRVWQDTKQLLEDCHLPFHEHFSSEAYGIREIVRELTEDREETDLLIIGGDGTMNEAVNGIADIRKVRLALVPCGSGNDLAKSLGLASDPEEIVRMLQKNRVRRRVNVGRLTMYDRYDKDGRRLEGEPCVRLFNISSGIGFDAAICEEVQRSRVKKILNRIRLGRLIYLYVALHQIFTAERTGCRITIDHEHTYEYTDLLLAVGMNEAYEGGGFRFAPEADPYDSLLDFCIADHLSQWDFFRIFPYAYSGRHTRFAGVHMMRGAHAEIETDRPVWVHTDGEIDVRSSHITLDLLPDRLKMLV